MPKVEFSLQAFPLLQEFVCPISKELIVEPVVASDGNVYNRANFEVWLRSARTSPVTRENLASTGFYVSRTIANLRSAVIKQYGLLTEEEFFDAVKNGRVEELREKNYFDFYLHIANKQGRFPVSVAIEEKNLTMLTYLLDEGATVDEYEAEKNDSDKPDFPLARACLNGFDEGIALLLTKNLTHCVSKLDEKKTVIIFAIAGASLETIKLLANAFPSVLLQGNADGYTGLHYAAHNREDVTLIRYLVENGLQINDNDNDDKSTPLHWLCRRNFASMPSGQFDQLCAMVDVMLELGASHLAKDSRGQTPLEYAKEKSMRLYDHLLNRCFREERFQTLQAENQSLKRKFDELKEEMTQRLADSQKTIEALEQKTKEPRASEPEAINNPSIASSSLSLFAPDAPKENATTPAMPPAPQ